MIKGKDIDLTHPIFSMGEKVTKLRKILSKCAPVNHFDYERYFYDGTCITAMEQPAEFALYVYNNELVPSLNELINNSCHHIILSEAIQLPSAVDLNCSKKWVNHIEKAKELNIHHRLCLVFKMPDYIEAFIFGFGKQKDIVETFMTYAKKLELFCLYFREEAKDILTALVAYPVIFDEKEHLENFQDILTKNDLNYTELITSFNLKKIKFKGNLGNSTLSYREIECLIWAAKNKSAKQIGNILSISPRTVEQYFLNIKSKFGCELKAELIELSLKNPILKYLIES